MRLDRDAAERAMGALGKDLGLDAIAAAAGVQRVINARMAEGIRLVSVRRGIDPTAFALLAFGGAAGLHATAVARQLSIPHVIVPRVASVLSAWGMLASEIRFETTRSHIGDAAAMSTAGLSAIFGEMEAEARARLAAVFEGPIAVARSADMRYGEQIFEINVPLDHIDWSAADLGPRVADAFHARHEELYTYAQRTNEVVLVNARVAVIGKLPALPKEPVLEARDSAAPVRRQRAHVGGGWMELDVHAFETLAPGQSIAGPALVEGATTCALIEAGDTARVTPNGWLDIELAP